MGKSKKVYSDEYSSKIDDIFTLEDDKSLTILDSFGTVLKKDIDLWEKSGILSKGTTSSDIDEFLALVIKSSGISERAQQDFQERKYKAHLTRLEVYDNEEASNLSKAKEIKEERFRLSKMEKESDEQKRKDYMENKKSEAEVKARASYESYIEAENKYSFQSLEVSRLEKELASQKALGVKGKEIKLLEEQLEEAKAELSKLQKKASKAFDIAEKDYLEASKNALKLKVPTSVPDPRMYAYLNDVSNTKFKEAMEDKVLGPRLRKSLSEKISSEILSGKSPADIVSMIEEFVVGKQGDRSKVHELLKSTSEDMLFMYQGALEMLLTKDKRIVAFHYDGPIDERNRTQCARWMVKKAGTLLASELNDEIAFAKSYGEGMYAYTVFENFTIYRGGHRCRHTARAITDVTKWDESHFENPINNNNFEEFVESVADTALDAVGESLSMNRYRIPALDEQVQERLGRLQGELEGLWGEELLSAEGQIRNIERMAKLEEGVKDLASSMDDLSDSIVDKVMKLSDSFKYSRPVKYSDMKISFTPVKQTSSGLIKNVKKVMGVLDEVYKDAREHHRLFNGVDIGKLSKEEVKRIRDGVMDRFGNADTYNERILKKIKLDVRDAAALYPTNKSKRREYLLSKGYTKDENSWLRNIFKRDIIDYVYGFSGSVEARALNKLKGENYGVYFQRNTLNYFSNRSVLGDMLLKEKGFISVEDLEKVKEELRSEGIDITNLMIERGGSGSLGILTPISRKRYEILFGGEQTLLSSRFI
jgi:hypothetical protein